MVSQAPGEGLVPVSLDLAQLRTYSDWASLSLCTQGHVPHQLSVGLFPLPLPLQHSSDKALSPSRPSGRMLLP